MHSNFELLSLIRNATPINPLANSGAFFNSLLSTFTSIVPFLNDVPFILANVGSSDSLTVESFITFRTFIPVSFSFDRNTFIGLNEFLSNLVDCAYICGAASRRQVAVIMVILFIIS